MTNEKIEAIMTEAVEALARWAASQPTVTRVEAETDPENIASQKVLQEKYEAI